jgi:hypothetical protein
MEAAKRRGCSESRSVINYRREASVDWFLIHVRVVQTLELVARSYSR